MSLMPQPISPAICVFVYLYLCICVYINYVKYSDHELNATAHLARPYVTGHKLLHRAVLLLLVLQVHPCDPVLIPVCQPDPESMEVDQPDPRNGRR